MEKDGIIESVIQAKAATYHNKVVQLRGIGHQGEANIAHDRKTMYGVSRSGKHTQIKQ